VISVQIHVMNDEDKPEIFGLSATSEHWTLVNMSSSLMDALATVDPLIVGALDLTKKLSSESMAEENATALMHRVPVGWKKEYLANQVALALFIANASLTCNSADQVALSIR
jgi:hypothetical protein